MFVKIFILSIMVHCHNTLQTTRVSPCVKHSGELPINTYIEGCSSPPCTLPKLQDAVAYVDFRAPRPIKYMHTYVTAYASNGFITVPVPRDLGDSKFTCNFISNAHCPLKQGDVLRYTFKMYIESFFPLTVPGTSATTELWVVDQDGIPVFCIRFPIKITPAKKYRYSEINSTLY